MLELFIPLGCGAYPPIELGGAPPPTGGLIPPWPGIGGIIGPGGGGMEAEPALYVWGIGGIPIMGGLPGVCDMSFIGLAPCGDC